MHTARVWLILLALAPWAAAEDVAALAAQLATDRAHEAADRLAALGPAAKDAVPQLIAALQTEDPELRWRAAWALSRIGPDASPAASALVVGALKDAGLPAAAASIALNRMGSAATDAVLAAMTHATGADRLRYLDLLRDVEPKPPRTVPLLLPLLGDPDDEIRWTVYDLLESMGPGAAAAAPALVRQLTTEDSIMVADAVVATGEPSVGPLHELATDATASPGARGQAVYLLARIGGPGVVAAKECLRGTADVTVWERFLLDVATDRPVTGDLAPLVEERMLKEGDVPLGAPGALMAMGPSGQAVLERLLFTASSETKPDLVSELPGKKAIPWLFRLAEASEPREVRHAALQVLARSKLDADASRRAATLAAKVLSEDRRLGCDLIGGLGPFGAPFAEQLRPFLGDRDPWVRAAAASALCRIGKGGDAEAAVLAKVVGDASKGRTLDYVDALGCLAEAGPSAATDFELLLAALRHESHMVQSVAAEGLARMFPALGENKGRVLAAVQATRPGFETAVAEIDDVASLIELLSVDWAARAATSRLVALGSRASAPLAAALASSDPGTRWAAAQALLRIDPEKAGDRAWPLALGSGTVAQEIEDLCRERPQVAIPNLMRALACNDPKARGSAAFLLGESSHRDAIPALRDRVAHDADQDVRCRALWALDTLLATR